jgi:hypothetical protein
MFTVVIKDIYSVYHSIFSCMADELVGFTGLNICKTRPVSVVGVGVG